MNNKLKTIIAAGLTAGTLDIAAAIIIYSSVLGLTTPEKVLQSVAGAIHGAATYEGGWHTALAGLLLHFIIALIFAALFVLMYPLFKKITANPVVWGIIYGCIVWLVMNYLVVPNSALHRWPKLSWEFTKTPLAVLIIIICVGMPISFITAKMNNG